MRWYCLKWKSATWMEIMTLLRLYVTLLLRVCATYVFLVLPELWLVSSFKVGTWGRHSSGFSTLSLPFSGNIAFILRDQSMGCQKPPFLVAECTWGTHLPDVRLITFWKVDRHICGPGMVTSEFRRPKVSSIPESQRCRKSGCFLGRKMKQMSGENKVIDGKKPWEIFISSHWPLS